MIENDVNIWYPYFNIRIPSPRVVTLPPRHDSYTQAQRPQASDLSDASMSHEIEVIILMLMFSYEKSIFSKLSERM